jgi:hypothetical protein
MNGEEAQVARRLARIASNQKCSIKLIKDASGGHVIEVYDIPKRHEIDIWIDGGWALMRCWGNRPESMAT